MAYPHFIPDGVTPYICPAADGYPALYLWINDGGGVAYTFDATAGDSSFEAEDSHFSDTLWNPFNEGTPLTDAGPRDDVLAEAQARYGRWLAAIHPDPMVQLVQTANDLVDQIVALVDQHSELTAGITESNPTAALAQIAVTVTPAPDPTE